MRGRLVKKCRTGGHGFSRAESCHSSQSRNLLLYAVRQIMWGRAPSPVQAERKLGKVGRSFVALYQMLLQSARLKAVPSRCC
jgi:hypothetical protein